MDTALWIVQILLALTFLMAGIMKTTQPIDRLKGMMPWIESLHPETLVRGIGILEILGGLGVILPSLTRILPWLTPVAAGGLVLTMIGALTLHLSRKDAIGRSVPSVVLMLLALFVIYGRAVAVPIV